MKDHHFIAEVGYAEHSAVIIGEKTLSETLARAVEYATYYERFYPGTVKITIDKRCSTCDGTGSIVKERAKDKKWRSPSDYKTCPGCKGQSCEPVCSFPFRVAAE
jgi:RecJ-like exonuclease